MEKDDILEKSRRENQFQDERERTIRIQGESFSLIFVFGIGLFLSTYKILNDIPVGDTLAMFWCCSFGCAVYKAVNLKQKSQGFIALFCLAMVVYNLVRYVSGW
ncbi:MAG: DUF6442 family protein [Lawsonibacter sp.]